MIGLYNCDELLKKEIEKQEEITLLDDYPNVDKIFIKWRRKEDNIKLFLKQTDIVEFYIKNKTSISIFDEKLSISNKEYEYLMKNNITLYEPIVNRLRNSQYLPFWTDFNKNWNNLNLYEEDRNTDIYTLNDFLSCPKISWEDFKCVIINGNKEYKEIGYIPYFIYEIIDSMCIPLISVDNKWLNLLFKDTIYYNNNEIDFFIKNWKYISFGIMNDFYERLKKYFPEMNVEYTANKILDK